MPNAKRTEVVGVLSDTLKIRLQAQPIEGKANEALIGFIAAALNVPKSTVCLTHGHTSKRKTITVADDRLTTADVKKILLA